MLQESIAALEIAPNGIYVDLTFGGGGHARTILAQLHKGKLFAFDQDPKAQEIATTINHKNFIFIPANARFMKQFLDFHEVYRVDGILADLGVSSYQIDTEARGFSIRWDGPIDMRMDPHSTLTAQHIIDHYTIPQLQKVLQNYGEIRNAYTLAKAITATRDTQPVRTTKALRRFLQKWAPKQKENRYYAQVFQALRIEVNNELEILKEILRQGTALLPPQGRFVLLSYHSLEDRLIKRFINTGNFEGVSEQDIYGHVMRPLKPLQKKPLLPSVAEIQKNNRARSAKLRVGIRTHHHMISNKVS